VDPLVYTCTKKIKVRIILLKKTRKCCSFLIEKNKFMFCFLDPLFVNIILNKG